MARTMPNDFVAEIVRIANESPIIPLFEIDVSATERLRLCPYLRSVDWPSDGGDTYEPYPLLFDAFRESGEEDATTATVTIPNADRQLIPTLILNRGLTDKRVICHLVSKETLDEAVAIEWEYEIGKTSGTIFVVTFELGAAEVYEHTGPHQRYSRWHCGWTFGDPDTCMYDTSRPGAYQTCPKTLIACIKRGDEEEASGFKRLHPQRARIYQDIPLTG